MSFHNSQASRGGSGQEATRWEQQQQHLDATNIYTSSRGMGAVTTTTARATITGQEFLNTFVLERYSRQNPAPTTTSCNIGMQSRSTTNNKNVAQTKMSTFGGVSTSPSPRPRMTSSYISSSNHSRSNNNNNTGIVSDTRSWSLPTTTSTATATATAAAAGRSLAETKEQSSSSWVHLSTPNHTLALTLKLSFRPQTQADLETCRPLLLIQSDNEVLEFLGLDRASVGSTRLRGIVKGTMIGFRYTSLTSSSSSSSSLTPGSNVSIQQCKFQVKLKTVAECAQCAALLSNWIECHSVYNLSHQGPAGVGEGPLSNMGSQTIQESSQDTDVTMVPPPSPSPLSPHPHLHQPRFAQDAGHGVNNANYSTWRDGGSQPLPPQYPNTGTSNVLASVVSGEDMAQSLRSAAAYTPRPLTPKSASTDFASALNHQQQPLPHQQPQPHQQQQQQQQQQGNPLQDQLLSIIPRFGSQPMPIASHPPPGTTSSNSSLLPLPVHDSTHMPMTTTSGTSGGNVGGSLATAGQSVQVYNPLTQGASMSVDNVGNYNNTTTANAAAATATTATSTTSSEISGMLNASDAVMQAKIDTILHDPNFPAVLLRMDRLLRGGNTGGNGISSKKR